MNVGIIKKKMQKKVNKSGLVKQLACASFDIEPWVLQSADFVKGEAIDNNKSSLFPEKIMENWRAHLK